LHVSELVGMLQTSDPCHWGGNQQFFLCVLIHKFSCEHLVWVIRMSFLFLMPYIGVNKLIVMYFHSTL